MRHLILEEFKNIKEKECDFKNQKWEGFYVGHFHISAFQPQGIPTDEMLFDFYNEVIKWLYTKV